MMHANPATVAARLAALSFLVTLAALAAIGGALIAAEAEYHPKIAGASNEGQQAIKGFTVPPGFKLDLFAAEPDVANPAGFSIDQRGRLFVCETFRQSDYGVVDNRGHMYWLDDDLASKSVADRRAMFLKWRKDKLEQWTSQQDRIRLLEDSDHDGKADKATVFAGGFNDLMDGTGASVLAWHGNVYYTCIPHLWLLRDEDGDGRADVKKSLSEGYGIKVALRGHDLHGLRMGPDGKVYYSIGDRSYNITTPDGRHIYDYNSGAVFRCNPDGSDLEVVYTGLRNPQDLVFDELGNLFTCDNNSDAGDQARLTWIVEGGQSGWRMSYQYLPDRGPWNRQRWWDLAPKNPAAFLTPPVAHITAGPSGLAHDPGVGLPEAYRGCFFVCDFRGGASGSGIFAFRLEHDGAGFKLVDRSHFVWNILATDCDFGYDGGFYISDWVSGWDGLGKGRIYRLTHEQAPKDPRIAQTAALMRQGFAQRSNDELAKLLEHADMRVRQEAQFALAARGLDAANTFMHTLAHSQNRLARLHAIWGLGMIGRTHPEVHVAVNLSLVDDDAEVRAQAAKVLGDNRQGSALRQLVNLLADASPRVRLFAAISLGKLGRKEAIGPLAKLLRDNDDKDPYLRHAGAYALALVGDGDALATLASDASPAVRMGALLAMRRLGDARIARFVNDANPRLVTEAALAIDDLPIQGALPALAGLIAKSDLTQDVVLRRVIEANFRLGGSDRAEALARFAARPQAPQSMRIEALACLADWPAPSSRQRVLGLWRPIAPRPAEQATAALAQVAGDLLVAPTPAPVRQAVAEAIGRYKLRGFGAALAALVGDVRQPADVRIAALTALSATTEPQLAAAIAVATVDNDAKLRKEGQARLAKLDPKLAIVTLTRALDTGSTIERQGAFATLAAMKNPAADRLLEQWLDRLQQDKVPADVQFDLMQAARQRHNAALSAKLAAYEASRPKDDPLRGYRALLAGGDAEVGRKIFWEKEQAACRRCHKVAGQGAGLAGPDLAGIGAKKERDYLLESIVKPNAVITDGFDSVLVQTDDGDTLVGVLKKDDGKQLHIATIDGLLKIDKAKIVETRKGLSPMPTGIDKLLTKDDLRNLVAYLVSLKQPLKPE